MGTTPFKLKSGNNMSGSSFKMMGSSPAKKRDILVDGVSIGSGTLQDPSSTKAKAKALNIEKKNEALRKANLLKIKPDMSIDKQAEVYEEGTQTVTRTGKDLKDHLRKMKLKEKA